MNAYDIVLTDNNKLQVIRYSVELLRNKENKRSEEHTSELQSH